MGSRSKRRTRNIPLEQALAAFGRELENLHQVVAGLVAAVGTDKVQAELDRLAAQGASVTIERPE
jgi:hypothetical protein